VFRNRNVEIYLIRHGQSESNLNRIISGQIDTPLSELGKKQARELRRILPTRYDRVYSSPLSRAKHTALLALQKSEDDDGIIYLDDLKEISFGDLEGTNRDHLVVDEERFINFAWLKNDTFHGEHGLELHQDFFHRTHTAFDRIVESGKREGDQVIMIFCHGGVIKSIIDKHLGLSEGGYKNTEIALLTSQNGNWTLQVCRDHILKE
jgi:broad specificity phosphatase PhoE